MGTAIKTRLIRIGNSRGIRIPKMLIKQIGLSEDVEIEVQDDQLILRSVRHPRSGWSNQLRAMAERGDDRLLDGAELRPAAWDDAEWPW